MKVEVPEKFKKIADPKEGEKLIGITAKGDDIYSSVWLCMAICEAETGIVPEDMKAVDMTAFKIHRTGWIEEPAPNMSNCLSGRPLGKLWVVYKEVDGVAKESAGSAFNRRYSEEKLQTGISRAGVIQFLTHDTSSTRRQLAEVLRKRAELIESEVGD